MSREGQSPRNTIKDFIAAILYCRPCSAFSKRLLQRKRSLVGLTGYEGLVSPVLQSPTLSQLSLLDVQDAVPRQRPCSPEPYVDLGEGTGKELLEKQSGPRVRFSEPVERCYFYDPRSRQLGASRYRISDDRRAKQSILSKPAGRSTRISDAAVRRSGGWMSPILERCSEDNLLLCDALRVGSKLSESSSAVHKRPSYTPKRFHPRDANLSTTNIDPLLYLAPKTRCTGTDTLSDCPSSLLEIQEFQHCTNLFLTSCCIVDPSLPDWPVTTMSADLLPREPLTAGECLVVDEDELEDDWTLRAVPRQKSTAPDTNPGQGYEKRLEAADYEWSYQLLLRVPLIESRLSSPSSTLPDPEQRPARELFAQIDVTAILESAILSASGDIADPDRDKGKKEENDDWVEDVWLGLAAEELRAAGRPAYPLAADLVLDPAWLSAVTSDVLDAAARLRSYYALSFILEPQRDFGRGDGGQWRVGLVSPNFADIDVSTPSRPMTALASRPNRPVKRLRRRRGWTSSMGSDTTLPPPSSNSLPESPATATIRSPHPTSACVPFPAATASSHPQSHFQSRSPSHAASPSAQALARGFLTEVADGFARGLYPGAKARLQQGNGSGSAERFFFDARRTLSRERELVCCVPLFGPDGRRECWACFLISGPVFEACQREMALSA